MEAIQSQLDMPVFTADFKANHAQSLSFGFVNSSLYTGSLNKLDVDNSTTYWSINNVTFSSGNNQLGSSAGISILMGMCFWNLKLDLTNLCRYWWSWNHN
jgi:hypothetical protein